MEVIDKQLVGLFSKDFEIRDLLRRVIFFFISDIREEVFFAKAFYTSSLIVNFINPNTSK